MEVLGSDNEAIGDVKSVKADHIIVRGDLFFDDDHYIPTSAIDSVDDNTIHLNVTSTRAMDEQWTNPPETFADPATTGTSASIDEDKYAVNTSTRPEESEPTE